MGKNRMVFCALAGALALTLAGCGETLPPPTPSEQPEATGAPQPAVEHGFTFAELRQYEFVFASGAGSWGTVLYVRPDGSFSGTFSDTTWEEYGGSTRAVLLCSEFTGQFTEPVRVNDYTYSVRIARIDYERAVGEEAFADGFHYYYTEPQGTGGHGGAFDLPARRAPGRAAPGVPGLGGVLREHQG